MRLASTVSVSKTVGFWNLRPMPRRAVSVSSSRVRSVSSSQTTRPVSGRVLPVMMSSIVVLPAPFGPTTARSSPLAMAMREAVDRLVAVEAAVDVLEVELGLGWPWRLLRRLGLRPPARRLGAGRRPGSDALDEAEHALRQEDGDEDEHRAEHEEPGLGQAPRSASSWSAATISAPSAAPTSVPRPPSATQMTISIELAGENSRRVDDADLRHVERAGDARRASPRR